MTRPIQLLIPELVPLSNKGEEAIVRGISDVLFPEGNCEIHLFDDVTSYNYQDGIHIYPVHWFISPWLIREFGLGANWEKIRDSLCSLTRNTLHKIYGTWVRSSCAALRETERQIGEIIIGKEPSTEKESCLSRLLGCDYIVAGHDGALDERVCHVIDVMSGVGKRFGIFGVELPTYFKSDAIVDVEYETLKNSEFFYCRTAASKEVSNRNFPKINAQVLPDPAFGMIPASDDEVTKLVQENELEDIFSKPVVMCTSCEPAPISRHSFVEIKTPNVKLAAHRQMYADLIRHIVDAFDVNILFLPHAVGPGSALDDRVVARDILKRANIPETRATVLEAIYGARVLKAVIRRGEFLVAERIHSMIGAVGVGTPFLFMGSSTDRRVRGIICEMVDMEDAIFHLNSPNLTDLLSLFDALWEHRNEIKQRLNSVYSTLCAQLEGGASNMRDHILS